jgi:hypothetical protein
MSETVWWRISFAVSVVLVIVLAWLWDRASIAYHPNPSQLTDEAAVERYVRAHLETWTDTDAPPVLVPTGVFVQSLRFESAADVHVTGYVWQKYPDGVPADLNRGFVLPEAVDAASTDEPRIAYRRRIGDGEVIGWYFEATLRQSFDYAKYPLDHKTVWIRLWPKDFGRDVILVPDLASYDSTRPGDTFGIDAGIVLGGWTVDETFFMYRPVRYDTDFGLPAAAGRSDRPELYFSVVIHRKVLDAFIVNLVPLLVCAVMLFAMLLTVSGDAERSERLGFSLFGVIGASSALFFVVVLAHVQLRDRLPGAGIVYIEKFYFLLYFAIIAVVASCYLFSTGSRLRLVHHRDNLIPKLAFWPIVLGTMVIITLLTF